LSGRGDLLAAREVLLAVLEQAAGAQRARTSCTLAALMVGYVLEVAILIHHLATS
jgi:hypothetical protein